jgi:hypothetical protein
LKKINTAWKTSSFILFFSSLSYFVLLFSLTRQVPFDFLKPLISIFVAVNFFFLIRINYAEHKINIWEFLFFLLLLASILGYSIVQGNSPLIILRFFFIIALINGVLLFRVGNIWHINIFKYTYTLQAIVVISIAILMPIIFDLETFIPIRNLVKSNGWGDIYSFQGVFYRVQILGNALLPILFFLTYIDYRESDSRNLFMVIISIVGCVFAGNLAFYLGIFIFILLYELKKIGKLSVHINKYKFLILLLFLLICPLFINYVFNLIQMKSVGDGGSIGARLDQIEVLLDALNRNYYTLLFGHGIGFTLDVETSIRSYKGSIYFELQMLYFLVQLGIIPFLIIVGFNIYLFLSRITNFNCRLIYFIYLLYSSANPYFLDSSHVAVLILLLALNSSNSVKYLNHKRVTSINY